MRFFYDLHIHSCLSPCGSDDMTPATVCGIAKLNGLDIVALTDHNSSKNCPAFFTAAEFYGITAVAGMELTTAEDIHVVCLFPSPEKAAEFESFVGERRMKIPNRADIFGNQFIMNEDDEITGREEFLLLNAADIPIESVAPAVGSLGGVCYPAHIDREANGVIATLGAFPAECGFRFYELNDAENYGAYNEKYGLGDLGRLVSSDAHSIDKINGRQNFLELPDGLTPGDEVRNALFGLLKTR